MRALDAWARAQLAALRREDLLRDIHTRDRAAEKAGHALRLDDNDYLDLARHPDVVAAAVEHARRWGAGATASRLVCGSLPCHDALEQALAAHHGMPAALLFGSGFLANLGLLTSLVDAGDVVLVDRLAHASLLDGISMSGARFHRYRHNDLNHLDRLLARTADARGRRWIVTESVFSMDGDCAPLAAIAARAADVGAALIVDEAHATGVQGPAGAGLCAELPDDLRPVALVGTLSKALGSYGGYVATSRPLRTWLLNRARSAIYTTALPPAAVGAARAALDVLQREPERGAELLARADAFRGALQGHGLDTRPSTSQIVPVPCGASGRALRVSAALQERGVHATAIRPPTVPRGAARIRFALSLRHSRDALARVAEHTAAACAAVPTDGNAA